MSVIYAYISITLKWHSHFLLSLSQFIKVFIASGIFLSYPLNGFVVITVMFSDYENSEPRGRYRTLIEYVVRLLFLFLTGEFCT